MNLKTFNSNHCSCLNYSWYVTIGVERSYELGGSSEVEHIPGMCKNLDYDPWQYGPGADSPTHPHLMHP